MKSGVESIYVVSSKSNSSYSIAVTKSLIGIAVALDMLELGEDRTTQRGGELGGDGHSTLITRSLVMVEFCSSYTFPSFCVFMIYGLSVPAFLPLRSVHS